MPKPLPLLGLLVATFFQLSACRDMIYCSGINTSGMPGSKLISVLPPKKKKYTNNLTDSSIYQSNGLCYDFCAGRYSFAILQLDECFCSNFAPVDSGDVGDCDFNCNGYPSDRCGGDELFGYFELRKRPSGTKDADGNLVTSTTTSVSTFHIRTSSCQTPCLAHHIQHTFYPST